MYVIAYKVYTTTLNSLILSNIQKQSNKSNRTLHIRICIYFLAAAWCISRVLIFLFILFVKVVLLPEIRLHRAARQLRRPPGRSQVRYFI